MIDDCFEDVARGTPIPQIPSMEIKAVFREFQDPLLGVSMCSKCDSWYGFKCIFGELGPTRVWLYVHVGRGDIRRLAEGLEEAFYSIATGSKWVVLVEDFDDGLLDIFTFEEGAFIKGVPHVLNTDHQFRTLREQILVRAPHLGLRLRKFQHRNAV